MNATRVNIVICDCLFSHLLMDYEVHQCRQLAHRCDSTCTPAYDCFINTAEVQCKKLNILNEPGTESPVSQISGQSLQSSLSLESTHKRHSLQAVEKGKSVRIPTAAYERIDLVKIAKSGH